MSLAKKCDRCGNLYVPENMNICGLTVNGLGLISRDAQEVTDFVSHISSNSVDLCPECLVSFANWLKNKPMTFNEIRQAAGLEPIRESNKASAQLYSEKENKDD